MNQFETEQSLNATEWKRSEQRRYSRGCLQIFFAQFLLIVFFVAYFGSMAGGGGEIFAIGLAAAMFVLFVGLLGQPIKLVLGF